MTKTFRDLGVDPVLCDELTGKGITHPFPIQELTLPLALEGHDLIGQARTGTGKTLAFGLPLLQRVDADSKRTQALVVVPTRELCLQVHSDLEIGRAKGLTSISVYGGVGYDEQIDALQAGAQVVVGTPGRLLDLLNRGVLDLSNVTQLVLDEADEMLDMGFLPDVERLVEACQGDGRHTMLFSATMPTAIVKLARRYMDHPTFTRADHEQKNTAPLVTQYFFEVHRMDKPRLLARILQSRERGGVYVFVRTKHMADRLVNDLEELRIPSIAVHGDLRQSTREKNLDRFRSGQATVLVCTEVAARGLDVTGVTHVVNYDCPDDEKMYLHRIGRTARAGEAGVAITFAEFNEIDRLNVIRKAVGATESSVQQVFSTSKQLAAMFDLPDERPWDHLTTRAGSDEARAKRESRSDGRPKGDRGQEGRGGDHDARQPSRRGERRDGGSRGRTADASDRDQSRRGRVGSERSSTRPGVVAESAPEAGTRAMTATPATTTSSPAVRSTSEATDQGTETTRTRTRTRARSRTKPVGSESTREPATNDEQARSEGDRDSARTGDRNSARTGDRNSARTGDRDSARTGDRDSARTAASDAKSEIQPSSGGRQRARGGQRSPAAAKANEVPEDRPTRSRSAKRSGRPSNGRPASGTDRDASKSAKGPESERSGDERSESRRTGRERRNEGSRSGGRSSAGGRDNGRSGRDVTTSASDSTVRVAKRGEEARGTGQPQLARRVKVEHLP